MSRWPAYPSFFWQQAPFARLLLPLLAAVFCYDKGWLPGPFPLYGCLISSVAYLALCRLKGPGTYLQVALFVLLQLCIFSFGWWRAAAADVRTRQDWFGHSADTAGMQLVKVLDNPAEKEHTWRMRVAVQRTLTQGTSRAASGQAFLGIYKTDRSPGICKGDLLCIPARWQPVTNAGNPFEFDYALFCRRQGIYHQQFTGRDAVMLYRHSPAEDAGLIETAHRYCQRSLDRYLKDTSARGLLQAMLLGDEHSFDPAMRQAYADTGVIHIISISGSHVAVLFLIITSLLFWLRGPAGQWIRYIAGVMAIWFYVLMAGAPPSAVRAALMFSIIAAGVLSSRQSHPLNTLLGAAFILLCTNPAWLFSAGFQLSFCAVLSLLLFYSPLYRAWPQTTWAGKKLWQAVSASIAAELLTAPLGIYYFHNFPVFFAVANLLAAALLGFLGLAGGMAVIVFSWLPPVAWGIAYGITALIKIFNTCILHLQRWNPVSFAYLQLSAPQLVLLYLGITGFAVLLLQKRRIGLFIGSGACCLLLLLSAFNRYHVLHQERLVAYNLGRHAQLELIHGGYHRVLYSDTVPDSHYTIKAAHTGWQAWRRDRQQSPPPYFVFKGKRLLQLRDELAVPDTAAFPADLLLVERPLKDLSPARLLHTFHPAKIVAAGSQPRWVVRNWKDSCARLKIAFHAVSTDGSFMME